VKDGSYEATQAENVGFRGWTVYTRYTAI